MSTIDTVLEPLADGTLHLPIPEGLKGRAVRITATLEPASDGIATGSGATPEMLRRRREALKILRHLNPFGQMADPLAWQKDIRKDRDQPGHY